MKIPFTNIELSAKQAIAAVATTVGTLWAGFSLLFGSSPVSVASAIATTAATNAITNTTGFAGYAAYVNKDRAASTVTHLYNAAANRLNGTKVNASATLNNASSVEVETVKSFEPRRSARLAAKK